MTASASTVVDEYDAALGYHPSVVPLDIRLGLTEAPPSPSADHARQQQQQQPLRWGILATGKVAHDFCQVLKFLRQSTRGGHDIVAVGSRTYSRAAEFAKLHKIPAPYGSYEELCADPNVDIVYVASVHPDHRAHAEMALNNGKHVLVEKPMTMKASDAEALYDLGRKLNLFVGEGMWTRFFPAVEWARMHLGDEEAQAKPDDSIGAVRIIQADFCIDGDDVGPYPTDSLYARDLGGGVAWTVGPYIIAAAMMPFGTEPSSILANGIVPDDNNVGELAVGVTLTFESSTSDDQKSKDSNGSPPAGRSLASGLIGYLAESCEETLYAGRNGRIKILGPAHCPTSATITRKVGGRSNGATGEDFDGVATASAPGINTVEFPLPPSTPEIEESGGIRMPNSLGFIYEAEAVRRLIAAGQITFPQWSPEESTGCIRTLETILRQIK